MIIKIAIFIVPIFLVNIPFSTAAPTDTPACSMNSSTAYTDVIILVDTSVNMGTTNLRKISTIMSLTLSKFPIGNQYDITQGYKNTQTAVISYNTNATIVANYTDINNLNDLASALNGLTVSTSNEANLYDGLVEALNIVVNCKYNLDNNCSLPTLFRRPTAIIVFASSANSDTNGQISKAIEGMRDRTASFFDPTFITVNFNPSNQKLTNLLDEVSLVPIWNVSMHNYLGSSNSLSKDIEWSILQANCYCGDVILYTPIFYYDNANKRYTKYAECIGFVNVLGYYPNSTLDLCSYDPNLQIIPSFVLTSEKQNFISKYVPRGNNPFTGKSTIPFYFGLHKNMAGKWVWYDYDLSEIQLSGFTDWAPGYPDNSQNECAVIDLNSTNGTDLVWKNYGCNPNATQLSTVFCQAKACDTSNLDCCYRCHYKEGLYTSSNKQNSFADNKKGKFNRTINRKLLLV